LRQLLGSSVRAVHWFNWSRRARVRSRREKPSLVDPRFAEPEHLEVHPLPSWADLTSDERTRRVRAMCARSAGRRQGASDAARGLGCSRTTAGYEAPPAETRTRAAVPHQ
jgi:hypothetical protein